MPSGESNFKQLDKIMNLKYRRKYIQNKPIAMTFKILYLLIVGVLLINCNPKSGKKTSGEIAHTSTIVKTRFFSDSSFWNKPLPEQVEIDTKSDHFIGLMKKDPVGAFFKINLEAWTIPVYEVNDSTPRYKICTI